MMSNMLVRKQCVCLMLCGLTLPIFASDNAVNKVQLQSKADHYVYPIDELFALSLPQLLNLKVTVASRNELPLWQTPSSVTVFTQARIHSLGVRNLFELLNYVPGFYNMMNAVEGNQSHIDTRGMAQKYASALLFKLNGQRLNDDYTGGISYFMRHLDIRTAKRVEIIRGPGSSQYGSNAYAGVINITTSKASQVGLEAGSNQSKGMSVQVVEPISDWLVGLNSSWYKDEGDTFSDIYDPFERQTTTTDPREVRQLQLYAEHEQGALRFNWLDSTRENYYLFRRVSDSVTFVELNHWMLDAKYLLTSASNPWQVSLSGAYHRGERRSQTALVPQGIGMFTADSFLFGEDIAYRSYNLSIDAEYQSASDLLWHFGIQASNSEVPNGFIRSNYDVFDMFGFLGKVQTFNQAEQRIVLDNQRHIRGSYAQVQWHPLPRWFFTLGVRYDDFNDVDDAFTPSFSAIYQINSQQGVKFKYGEGYRAPSLGDLYDAESGLSIGNQALKASEVKSTEVAYYWFNDAFAFSATVFDNVHQNLIGFEVRDTGEISLGNVAKNFSQGMEIEARWHINEQWRFITGITRIFKNHTELGDAMGIPKSEHITPSEYFSYQLQYQKNNWSWSLHGTWRNEVALLESNDDLLLVNSKVNYRINPRTNLHITINNALDERYSTSSYIPLGIDSNNNVVHQYPARGLEFMAGVTYQF
ncbi:TonB-dependent receptor plug domain-containing protein [Flocculibacter collagenilyticus]|uniref:TonB-dependent receptor plug domain-containing protein n=1 Tax=Flocculibacter collagenilyticus TaxID=2744479 RepID=UPI0018F6514D|nr:TonB-dependent receptor [Flocculibacter collagenilyticus]